MEPGWRYPEASGTWQDATSGSAIEETADIEELGALTVCKVRETGPCDRKPRTGQLLSRMRSSKCPAFIQRQSFYKHLSGACINLEKGSAISNVNYK